MKSYVGKEYNESDDQVFNIVAFKKFTLMVSK